jgi:sulfur-carrier protein adenylyltransferase/sulfurtransferase
MAKNQQGHEPDMTSTPRELSAEQVLQRRRQGIGAVYLDVREAHEWNLVRIPGAVHLPLAAVESSVRQSVSPDQEVIVYCGRGNRSAVAAETMRRLGYGRVASMTGGLQGWLEAGGEIED